MANDEPNPVRDPQDLARLFVERANAGDVEGLTALYEADALLAAGDVVATGRAEIRAFYERLLARRSSFPPIERLPALRSGDIAMTFARTAKGDLSVEVARRQADGGWLWAIDQLKVPRPADTQDRTP